MKTPALITAATAAALLGLAGQSAATLSMWQSEVAAGTPAVTTQFSTIASPTMVDVGALIGDRSFEFIFNADSMAEGSVSSALIGTQSIAGGRQGLKYEQWNNSGFFGATAFGVADYTSTVPVQDNVDLHAVFTSDGATTQFYLNGTLAYTFTDLGLALNGMQGIGAASNADATAFFDVLAGEIYGFASYNSALPPTEVLSHYLAFTAIPEPTGITLTLLAGLAWAARRQRSTV